MFKELSNEMFDWYRWDDKIILQFRCFWSLSREESKSFNLRCLQAVLLLIIIFVRFFDLPQAIKIQKSVCWFHFLFDLLESFENFCFYFPIVSIQEFCVGDVRNETSVSANVTRGYNCINIYSEFKLLPTVYSFLII